MSKNLLGKKMDYSVGDVISYREMCNAEEASLQRGMNYRLRPTHSVVLMSRRINAPYNDRIEEDGRVLIYEGHDAARTKDGPDPKLVNQPLTTPSGRPTQKGQFFRAAMNVKAGESSGEPVRVYEKIHDGVWVYNGTFHLVDAWQERTSSRSVLKFQLELADEDFDSDSTTNATDLRHSRLIPSTVKMGVWKRDGGRCRECGAKDNLHFDHIVPFSKGGSSLTIENIQLLCARHNLKKRDKIE